MSARGIAFPLDDYRTWNEGQSWHYEQHWRMLGDVLRVYIKRNAYNEQSSARVDIYSPVHRCWNRLCTLPIAQLDARDVSYAREVLTPDERMKLEKGCSELLARAAAILRKTP